MAFRDAQYAGDCELSQYDGPPAAPGTLPDVDEVFDADGNWRLTPTRHAKPCPCDGETPAAPGHTLCAECLEVAAAYGHDTNLWRAA